MNTTAAVGEYAWTPITVTSDPDTEELVVPSPRAGSSLCYNPHQRSMILFGGASHEDGFNDDIHQLELDTFTWKRVKTTHLDQPPARYEHTCVPLVYKDRWEMMLLFGAGENGPLDDIWCLDLEKKQWRLIETRGQKPAARVLKTCPVVYKDEQPYRLFCFGGGLKENVPVADGNLYCLDLGSLFWVVISKATPNTPTPRMGHTLTLCGDHLYLFGGMAESVVFDELWRFDISERKWSLLAPKGTVPSARCAHSAVVQDGKIFYFGGFNASAKSVHDDLYAYDPTTDTFEELSISGFAPERRLDHEMVQYNNKSLLFGGMNLKSLFNDIYVFDRI